MPITITLTPGEFATFVDCTPAIYNKLSPEAQVAVSDLRNTRLYEEAATKMAVEGEKFFGTVVVDGPPDIQLGIEVGDTIKIVGKLKPNYLMGWTFPVTKVNAKTVSINVPDEPQYRRFAGLKSVRIPRGAVERVQS